MNRRATRWSMRISAGGMLVVGGALAVATPTAAPAIAAGVLFAVGLAFAASEDLRQESLGLGLATAGVFGIGMGAVWALSNGQSVLAAAVAVLGGVSVAFGLGLDHDGSGVFNSVAATAAVTTLAVFLVGTVTLAFFDSSGWLVGVASIVLGLHEYRIAAVVFGGLIIALAVSLFLAISSLPPVAILGTKADTEAVDRLDNLQIYLGTALIPFAVIVLLVTGTVQSGPFTTGMLGTALAVLTSNTLIRVLLVGAIAVLLGLTALGAVMRVAWEANPERVQAWGTTAGGASVATVAVLATSPFVLSSVAASTTVTTGTTFVAAGVIGVIAAIALVTIGLLHRVAGQRWTVSVVGTGLLAIIAATVASDAVVAPLVAVAGLLLAWDATSHGRSLTAELGDAAPTEQGELAHGGASIAIAAVGVIVASVAAYLLPWLEPLLVSGNATTGVGVGAVLIVAGAVLVAID